MPFAPDIAGPHDPADTTPPRRRGSIRRTTTIDTTRPDGFGAALVVDARARDLRTDDTGTEFEVGTERLHIDLASDSTITAIEGSRALDALVGAHPMQGFRRVLRAHLADAVVDATLLHALLDDLVGANLVAGTSPQHHEVVNGGGPMTDALRSNVGILLDRQVDICAGWADGASMVVEIRRGGLVPAPLGPIAPDLRPLDDPLAWHAHDDLAPHSTRRRRRLDVGPIVDCAAAFDAHFRDTHVDAEGVERVVHEYSVRGRLDCDRRIVTAIDAEVRVLPWLECPQAITSAHRAVGVPLTTLRDFVRTDLRGTSTCTHLNDTLRSLGDLAPLLDALGTHGPRSGVSR